jgi:hypothetical protein
MTAGSRARQAVVFTDTCLVKLETVTGEIVTLSEWAGYSLNYVIECGRDWVADISIVDGAKPENYRKARVFASKNPGVENLMRLAHSRGDLVIKAV